MNYMTWIISWNSTEKFQWKIHHKIITIPGNSKIIVKSEFIPSSSKTFYFYTISQKLTPKDNEFTLQFIVRIIYTYTLSIKTDIVAIMHLLTHAIGQPPDNIIMNDILSENLIYLFSETSYTAFSYSTTRLFIPKISKYKAVYTKNNFC